MNVELLDAFPQPPGGRLAATTSGRYSERDTSGPTLGMFTIRTFVFRAGFRTDPIDFYARNAPRGWSVVRRGSVSIRLRKGAASIDIEALSTGTERVQLTMDSRCYRSDASSRCSV